MFVPSSSSVVRPHHVWAVAVICWKSLWLALCNFWITSSCAGHLVDWKHTAIRPQQSGIQHSFFIFSHIYRPTKKYKPQNQSCMRIPFCSLQLRNTVIYSQIKWLVNFISTISMIRMKQTWFVEVFANKRIYFNCLPFSLMVLLGDILVTVQFQQIFGI